MAKDLTFSHLGTDGQPRMVDVGSKEPSRREAVAEAFVSLGPEVAARLKKTGSIEKGNVIETARMAGIMAAKRTSELIPMCHPVPLDVVEMETEWVEEKLRLVATARCTARTGVEMEALTAVSVAALTVYDMCKSAARGITIERVRLLAKSGGRSGKWERGEDDDAVKG
jgi:cyclic pyranopterin phosphate synthase